LISACLVTRGDVDLTPILDSLPYNEVAVWNNAERPEDLRAYGRWRVAEETRGDVIYVQDDDCVLPPAAHELLAQCYKLAPAGTVILNIEPQRDVPWVGFGALIPRDLWVEPHARYLERFPLDGDFLDFCDAILTMQVRVRRCDGGHRDLPWAEDTSRTCNQPGYYTERRPRMLDRIRGLADEVGAGVEAQHVPG
jgi:hypothetical protein